MGVEALLIGVIATSIVGVGASIYSGTKKRSAERETRGLANAERTKKETDLNRHRRVLKNLSSSTRQLFTEGEARGEELSTGQVGRIGQIK